MRRTTSLELTAAVAALALSACGGDSPVAPVRAPVAPRIGVPARLELSGIVTDGDGRPVAGVQVEVLPSLGTQYVNEVSTATDARGAYAIQLEAPRRAGFAATEVVGRKAGYEVYFGSVVSSEPRATKSFRIHPIQRLTPGESAHVVVSPEDTRCGTVEDWICRSVRVTAPRRGMLLLEATADPGAPPLAGLDVYFERYSDDPLRFAIPVLAGEEVPVGVGISRTAIGRGGGYTLRTSLEP